MSETIFFDSKNFRVKSIIDDAAVGYSCAGFLFFLFFVAPLEFMAIFSDFS